LLKKQSGNKRTDRQRDTTENITFPANAVDKELKNVRRPEFWVR